MKEAIRDYYLTNMGIQAWVLRESSVMPEVEETVVQKLTFGVGDENADLLIIGNIPADGPAGLLLDRMLQAIGLQRETVYIANVPQSLQDLQQQLSILQPKIILVLGATAANSFAGCDIERVESFHPAHLLQNTADKKQAYQDLLKVQAVLSR